MCVCVCMCVCACVSCNYACAYVRMLCVCMCAEVACMLVHAAEGLPFHLLLRGQWSGCTRCLCASEYFVHACACSLLLPTLSPPQH